MYYAYYLRQPMLHCSKNHINENFIQEKTEFFITFRRIVAQFWHDK
jgi:hypothetical protein